VPRILLVDDDEFVREIFHRILVQAGYEVEDALNGEDALRVYASRPSDVVIADIVMPGMDGIEMVRDLRRLHADVKIIAMSGGGHGKTGEYLDLARRLGANATLQKPFSGAEILDAVSEVLADAERGKG
jgi:CheY-like chemotaxis protein